MAGSRARTARRSARSKERTSVLAAKPRLVRRLDDEAGEEVPGRRGGEGASFVLQLEEERGAPRGGGLGRGEEVEDLLQRWGSCVPGTARCVGKRGSATPRSRIAGAPRSVGPRIARPGGTGRPSGARHLSEGSVASCITTSDVVGAQADVDLDAVRAGLQGVPQRRERVLREAGAGAAVPHDERAGRQRRRRCRDPGEGDEKRDRHPPHSERARRRRATIALAGGGPALAAAPDAGASASRGAAT